MSEGTTDRVEQVAWAVVLEGNTGIMSDGITDIDGTVLFYRNYFPAPGDKDVMAKKGGTKHQLKINMCKKFADKMEINMNDSATIIEAVDGAEWVGIPVICKISVSEYQGVYSNRIDSMVRNIAEEDVPF